MSDVLATNIQCLSFFHGEEFSCSHYIFQFDKVVNRLERYVGEIVDKDMAPTQLNRYIQFE